VVAPRRRIRYLRYLSLARNTLFHCLTLQACITLRKPSLSPDVKSESGGVAIYRLCDSTTILPNRYDESSGPRVRLGVGRYHHRGVDEAYCGRAGLHSQQTKGAIRTAVEKEEISRSWSIWKRVARRMHLGIPRYRPASREANPQDWTGFKADSLPPGTWSHHEVLESESGCTFRNGPKASTYVLTLLNISSIVAAS